MIEGFHEYFKMKEEMDKAVKEQEEVVEHTQMDAFIGEEQPEEALEPENRMARPEPPRPPMEGQVPPRPEPPRPPMGGQMPPRPEPPRPPMGGQMPPRPNKPKRCGMVHVIKEGDTLYKLSRMYQVKVVDLLLANPYINIYNLQIGDEICVPSKAIPVVDHRVPYIIRQEDTLGSVLEKNDLTFEELADYNPFVKEISLPVNNVMFLPGKENE